MFPFPSPMAAVGGLSSPAFNPADVGGGVTLSDNNRSVTAGLLAGARAVVGKSTGKWIFEAVHHTASSTDGLGITSAAISLSGSRITAAGNSYGYEAGGQITGNGGTGGGFASLGIGDSATIAVDLSAGKLWAARNGVWQNGDPAAGTGGLSIPTGVTFYPTAICSAALGWTMSSPILVSPPSGFAVFK